MADDVRELDLPQGVADLLIETWGIERLHPPQAEALPVALSGRNMLLAIPTASGKSLVAYLAILQKLLVDAPGSRAFYLVPLKALAAEKVEELREAGDALGLIVGMAVGDRSGETVSLESADIIVATSEKFDSLLRNKPDLMARMSIVIADEVHLIHDKSRGPTMEINLARIRHEKPDAQIIALSATVGNAPDIAAWLDAVLIHSEWRPVVLRYGTVCENLVEPRKQVGPAADDTTLPPPFELPSGGDELRSVLLSTVLDGGQVLVFRGTRRYAEGSAKKLGAWMQKRLRTWVKKPEEGPADFDAAARLSALAEIAASLESSDEGTMMSERLAEAVRGGVAFHHAGLTAVQRRIIEDGFRARTLFGIAATPTLAAGVNLPARRVVVRDLTRWEDGLSRMLPRMEVHQMLGRAGRPRYDSVGDAWLIARNLDHADQIAERYFEEEPEAVESKLAADPAMRVHVLAAIATGGQRDREALARFFEQTFLATRIPRDMLQSRIDEILSWLATHRFITREGVDGSIVTATAEADEGPEDWDDELPAWARTAQAHEGVDLAELVEEKPRPARPAVIGFERASAITTEVPETSVPDPAGMTYAPTAFGERVSRLYLDPLSGLILREGLRRARQILCRVIEDRSISPWALLHLIACTPDFPPMWPTGKQAEMLDVKVRAMADQVLLDGVDLSGLGFLQEAETLAKSAWTLDRWIEEDSLREIESLLSVAPGDLRVRVDHADWLLNAARQICVNDEDVDPTLAEADPDLIDMLDIMRKRVANGCRQDLLGLIAIRGVGRVRARVLANHGYRTPLEVCRIPAKSQQRLADEWGWSQQMVRNIMTAAERSIQGRRHSPTD